MLKSYLETKKIFSKTKDLQQYKDDAPFRFKNLVVHHHLSSLKVNTDGVLLAAWASSQVSASNGLDIGSGSGVISLILAAEHPGLQMKGIDIHESSVYQANYNAEVNGLSSKVHFELMDATKFVSKVSFDLIISNPPFFSNSTLSSSRDKQLAKHTGSLNIQSLIRKVALLLGPSGYFYVVLPAVSQEEISDQLVLCGLYIEELVQVSSFPDSKPFNHMYRISRREVDRADVSNLAIYETKGVYHKKYRSLTRNLYLKF